MKSLYPLFSAAILLSAIGCERKTVVIEVPPSTPIAEPVAKTKTLETARLGGAVDAFERHATAENEADVKKAFAELDGEIAELEAYIAKHSGDDRAKAEAKLINLREYRAKEDVRFKLAQTKAAVTPATTLPAGDARSGAEKAEDSARKAGEAIEDGAKKAGNAIEDSARKVGDAIKDAVR